MLNKRGYLIPCTLTTKIVPNLNKGIQIIGFLKDTEIVNENITYNEEVKLVF